MGWYLVEKREFILNLQTPVIYRKGAKSAKDAKKIKDMPEVPEGFVIHLLGEWTKLRKLLCNYSGRCVHKP